MDYSWGTNRRFNAYSDFIKSRYGQRVQKITIDAGFTCPNRDGTCGYGGCTFCNNHAFNPSYNHPDKPVEQQIKEGIEFHRKRYRKARSYFAYFQAYTNTYASLERLQEIYQSALEYPGIEGIVIGTRPDAVDAEKLEYFKDLSNHKHVVIEYGIESVFDKTLERINRGHDFAKSQWAVKETAERGIMTGGHIMIGLPGETMNDWIDTVSILSELPLTTIKFHQLQIIKGTRMAREYSSHPEEFVQLDMSRYLNLMVDIIERLNPSIYVERIAGEVSPALNLNKGWGYRYDRILSNFENLLIERDTWQGRLYEKKNN